MGWKCGVLIHSVERGVNMKIYKWELWGFLAIFGLAMAGVTQHLVLDDLKVVKAVPTTHKVVAVTFDDGPHYKTTPELLSVLKDKGVKLTFFVLGQHAKDHPEILAQAVADGHEIGTHGYSHTILTKVNAGAVNEELDKAEQAIRVVAPKPLLFRPPGGAFNNTILTAANQHGYSTILWSVDPTDWRRPSVGYVVNNVLDNVKPGSIVLLHDGQYPLPTPEAIGIIIDGLRERGYELVTVSKLLEYYEVKQ